MRLARQGRVEYERVTVDGLSRLAPQPGILDPPPEPVLDAVYAFHDQVGDEIAPDQVAPDKAPPFFRYRAVRFHETEDDPASREVVRIGNRRAAYFVLPHLSAHKIPERPSV